jgi:hypothetical protein
LIDLTDCIATSLGDDCYSIVSGSGCDFIRFDCSEAAAHFGADSHTSHQAMVVHQHGAVLLLFILQAYGFGTVFFCL